MVDLISKSETKTFWNIFLSYLYRSYKITSSLFHFLAHDFNYIAPLPYAIGNLGEEIKLGFLASQQSGKKLIFLLPPRGWFEKLFRFRHCNIALHKACVDYSRKSIGALRYDILRLFYILIFIAFRSLFI